MDVQPWLTRIDRTTAMFQQAFGTLTEVELNWRPDAKTWSVAQNIHHLIVINETYYPVIERARAGKQQLPWIANVAFMVRFFGNTVLKAVEPERKRKMRTFPLWEPYHSNIEANILLKFTEHQAKLKDLISSSNDLLDRGVTISSPANRNIVYSLSHALDIITTHEVRHYAQAIEVNMWRTKNQGT